MLEKFGKLHLRVIKSIPLENLPQTVDLGLRSGFGSDTLRIGNVKIFADGALGPRTAAMLEPYNNEQENIGMLLLDAEELVEHGRLAVDSGLALAVHAIGDRANHEVLKAYKQLREYEREKNTIVKNDTLANSKSRILLKHRIEHVQIIHPQDAPLLGELGIIASMQPIHAISDMNMADRYWGERCENAYGWRTQLENGAKLAFGSDAPVEKPNPFWGMFAAITRQDFDGAPSPEFWYPEQRLNFQQALHAYTTGAAYAAGMENRIGLLAPGYYADLIVLDEDPFTSTPEQLRDIRPSRTMIGGKWVYIRE
jgi:predicted amidohydrolase YtcJ